MRMIIYPPKLTFIGDCHGKYDKYLEIIEQHEYTLQIGDFGFNYDCLAFVEENKHKILLGNHDNYDKATGNWFLGDYGVYQSSIGDIFFVRGAYSIDWKYRKEGLDWWKDEELSYPKLYEAFELYKQVKPKLVVTHDAPSSLVSEIVPSKYWDGELVRPSRTCIIFDEMIKYHNPERWIFGHHHRSINRDFLGTNFICLAELEILTLDKE